MIVVNELLGYPRIKIVQDTEMFHFSIDSMLLANFATINSKTKNIVDFCSGNFPIPMYLTLRTNANITGIEIQKKAYDLAIESLKLNNMEERIKAICGDINDIKSYIGSTSVDLITCNPPFFKLNPDSNVNKNDELTIARHEVKLVLEDIFKASKVILKDGGYLALVHRPERLSEIFVLMEKYQFSPSRLQFIYPKEGEEANHILIEARKGANKNNNLHILSPLYVYDSDEKWTDDILKIYNYGI